MKSMKPGQEMKFRNTIFKPPLPIILISWLVYEMGIAAMGQWKHYARVLKCNVVIRGVISGTGKVSAVVILDPNFIMEKRL